jgi:uncharacterized phage protein gp47/JayE
MGTQQITLQSYNQFLGAMIRTIIANTPLNDVSQGSVLLTILEAAAANDFENSNAILSLLNLLNIGTVSGTDLDNRAADFGLTRLPATTASGTLSIFNKTITKQSTSLYVLKPAPIAGQTVLYVNNTTGWTNSGTLYVGRGTPQFEGPIAYSSITTFPTFSQINLVTALQNNHLISDTVINAQGQSDRVIAASTTVIVPANNQNPEIDYITLRDAVLSAGETEVDNIPAVAILAGSSGNAPINTITSFKTSPFTGAAVSNPSAFTGGSDVETDQELRDRIIAYPNTLARGTEGAIISAVVNVSDSTDNQQVVSAIIQEPPALGQPAILYIDNGSGFQPSYAGQAVDALLTNANGSEQFLQTSNFPITRPQVINAGVGPFTLANNSFLDVAVDGVTETIIFTTSDFVNISTAQVAEIVNTINEQAKRFSARLTNDSANILLYPSAFDAEIIQVVPLQTGENPQLFANNVLQFPTSEFSFCSLYQNSTLLREKARSATLTTVGFGSWNISGPGDLSISVDGTPPQDRFFNLSNFPGASSFSTLTLEQWVTAFNQQFAGITATATATQTMQITSNQAGSSSALNIVGGSFLANMFPTQTLSAVGQVSQFILNRQTGNLEILTTVSPGDNFTMGTNDAKGFVVSAATISGTYNLSTDGFGRPAQMIVVADSTYCNKRSVGMIIGQTLTASNPSGNTMRLMSSTTSAFQNLLPGGFIFIPVRSSSWFATGNTSLFKVTDKGGHTTPSTDTYIDVLNPSSNITPQTVTVADPNDLQAFSTNGYPQLWFAAFTSNPPAASISDIVSSFNKNLINIAGSAYQTNAVKITSTTEVNGSIAIPVVVGNATSLFTATIVAQLGNPSPVANVVSSKSLLTHFRFSLPSLASTFLGRQSLVDVKGALSANAIPDSFPYTGTYSETIQSTGILNTTHINYDSIVSFTRGNNRDQFRSIAAILSSDQVGTQEALARTTLDHTTGDEFEILRPLQISASDNAVLIIDRNPQQNTINIPMFRTGQVNSGSNSSTFIPTTTEFSATDVDNQSGIDFSNPTVWSTSLLNTNFADYAVWMRAHNWYASGGVGSGLGAMIMRATEYGPSGNFLRFDIEYPSIANQTAFTEFANTPSFSSFSYVFGSGAARTTGLSPGNTITVTGPYPDTTTNFPGGASSSGNYYDYAFSAGTFSSVQVGDILSILPGSGVSNVNSGQFGVKNKSGTTVRVYNPTASVTSPGSAVVDTITVTNGDVVGTPGSFNITAVHDVTGSLNSTYFVVYDTAGSVAIWFNENGTGSQPAAGTNRYLEVGTILSGDSASTVATKTVNAVNQDRALSAGSLSGANFTITNLQNGVVSNATAGTSGFSVSTTSNGTNNASLSGKYFIIYDEGGPVSIWFDTGNQGISEPFDGAYRSIRVFNYSAGASAHTVALAIQQAITGDPSFGTPGVASNVVTVTNTFNGQVSAGNAGTLGSSPYSWTVSSTTGSNAAPETITTSSDILFFPLSGTAVSSIVATINASPIMTATAVGSSSLTISVSTFEEQYTYVSNATALGYGHNPTNLTISGFIGMYDGANWVKIFENTNPNFILKTAYILQGVSTIYSMDTAPNFDTATNGELFKLLPTTVQNAYHQFTQPALSQLPILATVNIADDRKNVQIKSHTLGSAGAVDFVGGTGNQSEQFLQSESEIETDGSGSYLLVQTPAFPDTFNAGDSVLLQNTSGVERLNRLQSTDLIDVINSGLNTFDYAYDAKTTGIGAASTVTITDVSSSYSLSAGFVWRWTFSGSGISLSTVNSGDLLFAYGSFSGWSQTNQVGNTGASQMAGFPIVAVNIGSTYVDLVNPFGISMSSTAVGGSATVQICPTPFLKWRLTHANYIPVSSLSGSGTVVTVNTTASHHMNTGATVTIRDSFNVTDGTYTPITVTGPTSFTFAYSSSVFSETSTFASIIQNTLTPTRYRLQLLGFNNLVRLSAANGQSPNFLNCGVAVDDYVSIGGSTFSSNNSTGANSGLFRVLAVDNNSIVFINPNATDQLNTITQMNNQNLDATWISGTNTVTGVAGTFKYVSVGDWVKQASDPDSLYLQVLSLNNVSAVLATSITLGANYSGSNGTSVGVVYDETSGYDQGVYLNLSSDIEIYEGDAVQNGDTLHVQNLTTAGWFNVNNVGSFAVAAFGTEGTTYRPFIRVMNSSGFAQTNVNMSVNPNGLFVIESAANKFYSIREVKYTALDGANNNLRNMYLTPSARNYKFNVANQSSITHLGKLGYSNAVAVGVDGYTYYTGLLQKVQYIVDGFEPDSQDFPGQRAVGAAVETLPPLPFELNIALTITTNNGVNLGDVSNNVKSTIINYIEGLDVGQPVVLSQIIADVMQVTGVQSVAINSPTSATQIITLLSNQKAIITANNISVA